MYYKPLVHLLLMVTVGFSSLSEVAVASGYTEIARQDTTGEVSWQEITSADDLWRMYPDRMRTLFAALDLDRSGLEEVRAAIQAGDTLAASEALLLYYRDKSSEHWFEPESADDEVPTEEILSETRQLSADTVTFSGATAQVPRLDNGGLQWGYTGPQDDQEFGYSLNGHTYFISLLEAWRQTNDPSYIQTFDRLIRDWIIHNPLPEPGDSIYIVIETPDDKLDWRDIGEVRWRTLEAGNRLGVSWPHTFYGFQLSEDFTPAARLLMLSGIPEHAEYLRQNHKEGHNWTTMEMNGLALAGLVFPEFQRAEEWADYALDVMNEEIYRQVYPDGVQKELSTKTQWVALRRFESVAENFRKSGRDISDDYIQRLQEMYNYLAYSMRPDGHQPLNNDSDREDLRSRVLKAAKTYDRPDWIWIATNGREGVHPEGLPSVAFPWAGIHVMRNGWDKQAHWAFFDTGPFGTGHQHADKLHLSIAAYGRDLLVDGGRYTHENYWSFDPTVWRGYFRSSFSHNVIHVDGKGQNDGSHTTDKSLEENLDYLSTRAFDYARGTFSGGYEGVEGEADHTRVVLYVRDRFWVVIDRIRTDRPRQLQAVWHYAPGCSVETDRQQVVSTDPGEGNLRIVPAGDLTWELDIVQGQTDPFIQGWYSPEYGRKEPNQTAVYTSGIQKSAVFAWVLVPAAGEVPRVDVDLLHMDEEEVQLEVEQAEAEPVKVTVPLEAGTPRVE